MRGKIEITGDITVQGKIEVSGAEFPLDPENVEILKKVMILVEPPGGDIEKFRFSEDSPYWRIHVGGKKNPHTDNVQSSFGLGIQKPDAWAGWGDMYIHIDRNSVTEPHQGKQVAYIEGLMCGSWATNFWFKDKKGMKHRFTKPPMNALAFYMEYLVEEDLLTNIRVGITPPQGP